MGWAAITRLLAQGRSLSGREPNTCFLNLGSQKGGTPRFADASAATGFHFSDDSRSLGLSDWDFDGDLDVWMLNRSAPGIRYLQNNTPPSRSVSLKLIGTTSNRNAIGARVVLKVLDQELRFHTLSRTVQASGSFLSQSSFWLHFGLGDLKKIKEATVVWPSGVATSLTGLDLKKHRFFKVREDSRVAQPWIPPTVDSAPTSANPLEPPPLTNAARIVLGNRPLFPSVADFQPAATEKAATLVTLWAESCPICARDFAKLPEQLPAAEKANLRLAFLDLEQKGLPPALASLENHPLSAIETGSLDAFQQAISAIHLPLATPTSFLIDPSGRVAVVYRGSVDPAQAINDLDLVTLPEGAQPDSSVAYLGDWFVMPKGADPAKVAFRMHDDGLTTEGIAYLSAEIANAQVDLAPKRLRPLHELFFSRARLWVQLEKVDKALADYRATLELDPSHLLSNKELARFLFDEGKPAEALPFARKAVELQPNEAENHSLLAFCQLQLRKFEEALAAATAGLEQLPADPGLLMARAFAQQGLENWAEAIEDHRQVVTSAPALLASRNNLAWILATCPDESLRRPEIAGRICAPLLQLTGHRDFGLFQRTAAACLASQGNFSQAIAMVEKAIPEANSTVRKLLENDRVLYQTKRLPQ